MEKFKGAWILMQGVLELAMGHRSQVTRFYLWQVCVAARYCGNRTVQMTIIISLKFIVTFPPSTSRFRDASTHTASHTASRWAEIMSALTFTLIHTQHSCTKPHPRTRVAGWEGHAESRHEGMSENRMFLTPSLYCMQMFSTVYLADLHKTW